MAFIYQEEGQAEAVEFFAYSTACIICLSKCRASRQQVKVKVRLRLHWLETSQVSTWPHQLEDVEESHSVDSGLLC